MEDAKRHFAAACDEAFDLTDQERWLLKLCRAPCRAGHRLVLEWLPPAEGWYDLHAETIVTELLKYEHFELADWFVAFAQESGRRFRHYLAIMVFNQAEAAGHVGVLRWLFARPGRIGPLLPRAAKAALAAVCATGDAASVEWAVSVQPPGKAWERLRAQQERAKKEGRWAVAETIGSVLEWSAARAAWVVAVARSCDAR